MNQPTQIIEVKSPEGDIIGQTTSYEEAKTYVESHPGHTMDRTVHTQDAPELKPLPSLTQ